MPIKFTCPHCQRIITVKDQMAGKKGGCPGCKRAVTVPAATAASADVESQAAALFADEPAAAAPVETKTIDLNCPFCDEAIHLPANLAGKRAPCPECKRIIKVPELEKREPLDWRKAPQRGPAGARLPDQAAPEGAWGSATPGAVSRQTLVEAGVIPKVKAPRTLWQKMRWPVYAASIVLVLGIGSWIGYGWWARRAADRALEAAINQAQNEQNEIRSALHLGAGEYYLNGRKDDCAKKTREQWGKALTGLKSASSGSERDALMGDLALAFIELGGTDSEDLRKGRCLPWEEVQKMLRATLGEIQDAEARRQTIAEVSQRLIARGQTRLLLPLIGQVYAAADADKAAALAIAGFELLRADDRATAEKAADDALRLYEDKKPPPLRPEVIALALVLNKKTPKPGKPKAEKANEHIGEVEALARQDQKEKARLQAGKNDFGEEVRFQALLALAANGEAQDVEAAIKMAEEHLQDKPELSWLLYRLVRVGIAAGLPEERLRAATAVIADPAVRGRAQLAILRDRLEKAKQGVEDSAADPVEAQSVARLLAAQALARHNTRLGSGWAKTVQSWPQPAQAFGSLGVALGLQDRDKGK